jgi:hypothetical protein
MRNSRKRGTLPRAEWQKRLNRVKLFRAGPNLSRFDACSALASSGFRLFDPMPRERRREAVKARPAPCPRGRPHANDRRYRSTRTPRSSILPREDGAEPNRTVINFAGRHSGDRQVASFVTASIPFVWSHRTIGRTCLPAVRPSISFCRPLRCPRGSVMNSRRSFDHLVGAGEQRGRHLNSEHLGSLHIDDQFEMGWLFDR